MFMRNLQNVNIFYFVSAFALCWILMIQIRQIYDNKLKYNRYLGYKEFVSISIRYMLSKSKRCI